VKQWDADNFENVVTLTGHHGEIWTLAISSDGKFVATAGHDRSIRLWQRTSEPLVLEDERETEREAEADLVNNCFITNKTETFITQRGFSSLLLAFIFIMNCCFWLIEYSFIKLFLDIGYG